MSQHPDDGTFQALLDGELEPTEQARVEAHVSACEVCAARLAEARAYQREADRLVEVMQVPEVLAATPARRRIGSLRPLAWAASILLAVSLGYWGRGAVSPAPRLLQEDDRLTAAITAIDAAQEAPVAAAAPLPAESVSEGNASERVAGTGGAEVGRRRQNAARSTEAESLGKREEAKQVAQPPAAPVAAANEAALDASADYGGRPGFARAAPLRVVTMEEAVRVLGGQILLIDGLMPDHIESGPGTAVPGAEPGLPVVRVVYGEGNVTLDQQRIGAGESMQEALGAARAAAAPSAAVAPTAWRQAGGIRFVVTGSVSPDSLVALAARVG